VTGQKDYGYPNPDEGRLTGLIDGHVIHSSDPVVFGYVEPAWAFECPNPGVAKKFHELFWEESHVMGKPPREISTSRKEGKKLFSIPRTAEKVIIVAIPHVETYANRCLCSLELSPLVLGLQHDRYRRAAGVPSKYMFEGKTKCIEILKEANLVSDELASAMSEKVAAEQAASARGPRTKKYRPDNVVSISTGAGFSR
jgi:hypothetical protein